MYPESRTVLAYDVRYKFTALLLKTLQKGSQLYGKASIKINHVHRQTQTQALRFYKPPRLIYLHPIEQQNRLAD